jgi:hypothetical protein
VYFSLRTIAQKYKIALKQTQNDLILRKGRVLLQILIDLQSIYYYNYMVKLMVISLIVKKKYKKDKKKVKKVKK